MEAEGVHFSAESGRSAELETEAFSAGRSATKLFVPLYRDFEVARSCWRLYLCAREL